MKKILKGILLKIFRFLTRELWPYQERLFKDLLSDAVRENLSKPLMLNESLLIVEKEKRAVISTLNYLESQGIHQKRFVREPYLDGTQTAHFRKTVEFLLEENFPPESLFLEFGVYKGATINLLAKAFPQATVHGFDGFEGLPEDWHQYDKETWKYKGESPLPRVEPNVKLHVGWFDKTLPTFVRGRENEKIAFLHVDCDVYSSTKTVFDALKNQIVVGTIIRFDELFGYYGYEFHEMKAFNEFVEEMDVEFEPLNYSFMALTLKITKIRHGKKL